MATGSGTATAPLEDIIRTLVRIGVPIEEAVELARYQRRETLHRAIIHTDGIVPTDSDAVKVVEHQPSCVELPKTRAIDRLKEIINSSSVKAQEGAINDVYGDQYRQVDCSSYLKQVQKEMAPTGEPLKKVPYGPGAVKVFDILQEPKKQVPKEPGLIEQWLLKEKLQRI